MDTTGTIFLPPGQSTISGEVDALFNFILFASILLFLLVVILSGYFVFRYRRRTVPGTTYGKDHNVKLEIAWTVIPTILIIIVFIWGFRTFLKMRVVPKDAIEIKVTGQKWFWSFDYPEGVNTVNELVVPVDKPVKLLMSSKDVIHSFFVPNFRIKMDVLPNRYSITWFEATSAGEYNLFCTEFCGTGHSEMIGRVKVVSEKEYGEWLEATAIPAEGISPVEYGARLYQSKACITCHSVDGSLNTGPTFYKKFGEQEMMADGSSVKVDENYLRESILNPNARVVAGYAPVMPTYQGILKDREIDALIAFIKSLKEDTTANDE
ncbi:MAG: cytochrome c oxidase subunit II [Candidatus Zixiibacteriota bacterium]|nr:MAG: cytochrome c oxidase subunit II [candidate division Zixibacteria bacterium]